MDTLFTDVTCPEVPKRFLWWTWRERKHSFVTLESWREPGFYSTIFCARKLCTKCWAGYTERIEREGP